MEKIKSIFKARPNLQEVHVTSDNIPFFKDHDAKTHAAKLKNKSVKAITRSEALSEATDEGSAEGGEKSLDEMGMNELRAEIKRLGSEEKVKSLDEAKELIVKLRAEQEQD